MKNRVYTYYYSWYAIFFKHKRFLRNLLPPNKHLGYVIYTVLAIEVPLFSKLVIVHKPEDQIVKKKTTLDNLVTW